LLAEESAQRDAARVLMYLAYVLPLFGPMLKMLHIQLSVPAYVALFLVVASIIRGELVTDDLRKAAIVSSVQA